MSLTLYNLSLKKPTQSSQSLLGQFTNPKKKTADLLRVNGDNLQLFTSNDGKLDLILTQQTFNMITKVDTLRVDSHDFLVVTSDSGNLSVLKYVKGKFVSVIQQPYGKTGFSRIIPGEYLNVANNLAIMIGAIERGKLIYRVDIKNGEVILNGPIEVKSKGLLTLTMVSLIGTFNPTWVALEIERPNEVLLNWYVLDQGLNHVIRHGDKVSPTANYLAALPDGGVFIFATNQLTWIDSNNLKRVFNVPFGVVVHHALHVLKRGYFMLVKNTEGDLYKISIASAEQGVEVSYFDKIDADGLIEILGSGFLFGGEKIYRFESLGGGDNLASETVEKEATKVRALLGETELGEKQGEKIKNEKEEAKPEKPEIKDVTEETEIKNSTDETEINNTTESHTAEESNLSYISSLKLLSPIVSASSNLILSTSLKKLTSGFSISPVVSSQIPMTPTNIFTTTLTKHATADEYLVLTSADSTLILSIGESIEEVEDSGLLTDQATIGIQQVGKESLVQVWKYGVRHVKGAIKKVTEWHPPAGISITHSAASNSKLLISLSNAELVYFEFDLDDALIEYQERVELPAPVKALTVGTHFAVVSTADQTVQTLSLQESNCLETLSLQALSSNALSLVMTNNVVHIGMENGVYVVSHIDEISGAFSDTRIKYLGPVPVVLSELGGQILAISNKPFISYILDGEYKYTPLLTELTCGVAFTSNEIGEAIVGLSDGELVIFTLGEVGFDPRDDQKVEITELKYPPRGMVTEGGVAYVIGTGKSGDVWNSSLDVVDVKSGEVVETHTFPEKLISVSIVSFKRFNTERHLIVGSSHALYTYKVSKSLTHLHKTEIDGTPQSLLPFNGRLLVASGNNLRLYDLGQKQLLRKSSTTIDYLTSINKVIYAGGDRVVLSGGLVVFAKYDPAENKFIVFADDVMKRHVTALACLDYDTVIGADKFGSIFVSRLPAAVSRKSDSEWTLLKSEDPIANGSMAKLQTQCEFYVGDVITSFVKNDDSIVYYGLHGTLGVMLPMATKQEADFMMELQEEIRGASESLLGGSQVKFRGTFNPVMNVIDGDYLEGFYRLEGKVKVKIGGRLKRSPREVERRLGEIRNRHVNI